MPPIYVAEITQNGRDAMKNLLNAASSPIRKRPRA
jgi:hypothetical protein